MEFNLNERSVLRGFGVFPDPRGRLHVFLPWGRVVVEGSIDELEEEVRDESRSLSSQEGVNE